MAAMPLWLPHYETRFGMLDESLRLMLTGISPASIDRLLKPVRVQHPRGLSGTRPGTLLKHQIPIRAMHWDITLPGFMEADTVAHCGNSLAGDFVWSLSLTDILTGWTECRATWNKGSSGVLEQIKTIEKTLPFQLRDSIATMAASFSIPACCVIFTSIQSSRPLPDSEAQTEGENWSALSQALPHPRNALSACHELRECDGQYQVRTANSAQDIEPV